MILFHIAAKINFLSLHVEHEGAYKNKIKSQNRDLFSSEKNYMRKKAMEEQY